MYSKNLAVFQIIVQRLIYSQEIITAIPNLELTEHRFYNKDINKLLIPKTQTKGVFKIG